MAAVRLDDSVVPVTVPPPQSVTILPKSHSPATVSLPLSSKVSDSAVPPLEPSLSQGHSTTPLWSDLFSKPTSIPHKTYPPPSYLEDGTPVVRAPPEILLKASQAWKGHLLCTFFGNPPSPAKIYSDLIPIWGKNGSISVRQFTEGTCLILVPSLLTRKCICDVGFWSAGTVSFSAVEWSPTAKLHSRYLTSAPLWITLRDVPPQLWSPDGFKLIASGVGSPLPSNCQTIRPDLLGSTKLRVIVDLEKPLPPVVIVQDDPGNEVKIGIDYGRLPGM